MLKLRILAVFQLILLISLCSPLAQAEDSGVMPPPANVQNSPESTGSADQPSAAGNGQLSDELNASKGSANVQIHTKIRQDGTRVDEYSRNGHVYMIKVTPPHGLPPYYLYKERSSGTFHRLLPGAYKHITPPEWVIKKF